MIPGVWRREDRGSWPENGLCKYLLAFVYIPWCALYMSMMMNEISQHTHLDFCKPFWLM
jgi:hypothetical protein